MNPLDAYRQRFRRLNINRQNGGAPHKPVLLLAVIDLYARGLIRGNRFPFSDLLIDTFRSVWQDLVGEHPHFSPTIIFPVWKLRSDGFWKVVPIPGKEFDLDTKDRLRSFEQFRAALLHLEIDRQLALLLSEPASRLALQQELLQRYFPGHAAAFLSDQADRRLDRYLEWSLREPQAPYLPSWDEPRKKLHRIEKEEEKYVRDGKFARNVLYAYEATCCISGHGIRHPSVTLVDACHIVQHAQTGDNHIQNGIALSPTLHRAFDSYLFTITEDFRVRLSRRFTETPDSSYRLRQFEGREIRLPREADFWPGKDRLRIHNERFMSLEG